MKKKLKDFLFKARFFLLEDVCPCCERKMNVERLGDLKCHGCGIVRVRAFIFDQAWKDIGKTWGFLTGSNSIFTQGWVTKKEMWRQSKLRVFQ